MEVNSPIPLSAKTNAKSLEKHTDVKIVSIFDVKHTQVVIMAIFMQHGKITA
jgi:hypothetical protein